MAENAGKAVSKYSKEELAKKWANLKNKLSRVRDEAEVMGQKTFTGLSTWGTFSLAYYARRRRQLAGKSVTFDKKGRVDAFFWPGLAVAVFGVTPFSGSAGPYVTGAGAGIMCAGSVDFIDKMAKDHHEKK